MIRVNSVGGSGGRGGGRAVRGKREGDYEGRREREAEKRQDGGTSRVGERENDK